MKSVGLKFGPKIGLFNKNSCGSEARNSQLTFSDATI